MPKNKKFQPADKLRSPMRMANFLLMFAITGVLYLIFASATPLTGYYGSVEKDQATRINNARTTVPDLQHIECLNAIAEIWTKKMAAAGGISHNPNLANEVSYACGNQWTVAGENVGVTTAQDNIISSSSGLFNAFMASPGHKANILRSDYTDVGVGAYVGGGKLWVTQVFAKCPGCGGAWATNATLPADPKPAVATGNSHLLRNSNTGGSANTQFSYGTTGDKYLYCDWDGDGDDTVAVFRPSNGTWYIRNTNSGGASDITFAYGASTDTPVCGDWDGDGKETIGIFRPSSREWKMRNTNAPGVSEISFSYGGDGDLPVVGDWDGDGKDSIGVFRPSDRTWHLRNTNSSGVKDIGFAFGGVGDKPLVGDWDGNGITTIGVWRYGTWLLRNSNTGGSANLSFNYGTSSDKPLVGDWDGNRTTTIGVNR